MWDTNRNWFVSGFLHKAHWFYFFQQKHQLVARTEVRKSNQLQSVAGKSVVPMVPDYISNFLTGCKKNQYDPETPWKGSLFLSDTSTRHRVFDKTPHKGLVGLSRCCEISPAFTSKGRSNSRSASFLKGRFSSSTAPAEWHTDWSQAVLGLRFKVFFYITVGHQLHH